MGSVLLSVESLVLPPLALGPDTACLFPPLQHHIIRIQFTGNCHHGGPNSTLVP